MTLARARGFLWIGLGLIASGALLLAWVLQRHAGADLPMDAELVAFAASIVLGAGLIVAWIGGRTLRLAAASQAIASWRVPEAEWQRYVAACRMREGMPGALQGAVPLDLAMSTDGRAPGIEVLALRHGFRVGDSFHEVGTLGADVLDMRVVDAPAPMFEFNMRYAAGDTSSVRLGVRIPIAAGAQALVKQVEDHWIAREPLQVMTREQLRARERSGWVLVLLGVAALLGVVALFVAISPPGWAAIAPIGSLALAGVGFFRAIGARSVRWRKFGQ